MKTIKLLVLSALCSHAADPDILQKHLPTDPAAAYVEGESGWRFLPSELRHHQPANSINAPDGPAEAILDTKRQLDALGIRLIVVPVPTKLSVYPEKLDPKLILSSDRENGFVQDLRSKGVEVLDLSAVFQESEKPVYCLRDSHWNGAGIALAADRLAEELQKTIPPKDPLPLREEEREISGDLGGEKEKVALSVGEAASAEATRASPILLFGDSNVLVFQAGGDMHAVNAGLSDQLASRMGSPIDLLGVRGSGATAARVSLARRARANPEWLKGKKVVIWCFAARELTQGGAWKPVPLLPD